MLTELPIRFALRSRDGRRSVTWRVWGSKSHSDVYVAMRHVGGLFKTSLHESGECNIGYTREMAKRKSRRLTALGGTRHAFTWRRPITGQNPDCTWSYALRLVIPYSELRIDPAGPERHLDRVTFIPTETGAIATQFSFVFVRGKRPPGWPGMNDGSQVLCRMQLANDETLFVVYEHLYEDSLFVELLTQFRANRAEIRRQFAESRDEPLGPHFRDGAMAPLTEGGVVVVEIAGD